MSKYQITLVSSNGLRVTALRGMSAPKVNGGYGGWEEVSRPRKVGLTEWRGRSPFRLALPLLIEGFPTDSVEVACSTLERMALPGAASEPPQVTIQKGAVPHSDLIWVIESLDWGDMVIYGDNNRVRQDVTVNLLQYVKADRLNVKGGANPGTHPTTYTVKKGDNLRKAAVAVYGDPGKAKTLQQANGIRDPNNLTPGTVLRCP
jgi:hypothetical protein